MEKKNLAMNPKYKEILREMRENFGRKAAELEAEKVK
jgi:hypothetical protein